MIVGGHTCWIVRGQLKPGGCWRGPWEAAALHSASLVSSAPARPAGRVVVLTRPGAGPPVIRYLLRAEAFVQQARAVVPALGAAEARLTPAAAAVSFGTASSGRSYRSSGGRRLRY